MPLDYRVYIILIWQYDSDGKMTSHFEIQEDIDSVIKRETELKIRDNIISFQTYDSKMKGWFLK